MPDYEVELIETVLERVVYTVRDVPDKDAAYELASSGIIERDEADYIDVIARERDIETELAPPTFKREIIKVEWEHIGEGWSGDYNPDDPNDEPLLRFTVYIRGVWPEFEWEQLEDASYCTQMPVGTTYDVLEWYSDWIFNAIGVPRLPNPGYRKVLEQYTHFTVEHIRNALEESDA